MLTVPAYNERGERIDARQCPSCGNYEDEQILENRREGMGWTEERQRKFEETMRRKREQAKEPVSAEERLELKRARDREYQRHRAARLKAQKVGAGPDKKGMIKNLNSLAEIKPALPASIEGIYLQLRKEIAKEIIGRIAGEFVE